MANQFKLTNLFKAIHAAVDEAADVSREATNRWIQNFFNLQDDGTLEPKYITIKLPIAKGGVLEEEDTKIPLFSLASHQSLVMDKLLISFEVDFHNCDGEHAMVSAGSGLFSSSTKAKIEMSFMGEKAPEGVMKINDILVHTIPK